MERGSKLEKQEKGAGLTFTFPVSGNSGDRVLNSTRQLVQRKDRDGQDGPRCCAFLPAPRHTAGQTPSLDFFADEDDAIDLEFLSRFTSLIQTPMHFGSIPFFRCFLRQVAARVQ